MIELPEVLKFIQQRRGESFVFTTMGSAREWSKGDVQDRDFMYIPSSMGQLPALALGFALAQPTQRVIAVNGDGCMLMNLGSLVTISAQSPQNLVLCVVNNGEYEVTGHQPTVAHSSRRTSNSISFSEIAKGAGWRSSTSVSTIAELTACEEILFHTNGPHFIEFMVKPMPGDVAPRSPGPAPARAHALRELGLALQQS
mgnify:FL=1